MEKAVLLLVAMISLLCLWCSSVDAVEMFYVKPTTGPTTECPSGDSPCHSLQYYANHSSFTNNSRFLFLEGEHHLDSVVTISNVANLSLVGASPGVEIICKGYIILEQFTTLNIENMVLLRYGGYRDPPVYLNGGENAFMNNVTILKTLERNDVVGIMATDVAGSFSVLNSTFFSNVRVNYPLCGNQTSNLEFSNDWFYGNLYLESRCSHTQIGITDCIFDLETPWHHGVGLVAMTTSLLVTNSVFNTAISMVVPNCSKNPFKLVNIVVTSSVNLNTNCIVLIEDSIFASGYRLILHNSAPGNAKDESIKVALKNVTFANCTGGDGCGVEFASKAVRLVNCTFENNIGSALVTKGSNMIFEGNHVFRNNSALVGGGIQLLDSSIMYLRPHTRILFEDNRAEYVGGAIYTNSKADADPCVFQFDSQTAIRTIVMNFVNNEAGYAGSSLYGGIYDCYSVDEFYEAFNTSNTEADPSAIASDPGTMCFCDHGKRKPNCSYYNRVYSTHAFPGQDFPVRLAVVGQGIHGVVPGAVRAYFNSSYNATLGLTQNSQASKKPYCVNFYYSVNTTEKTVEFKLTTEYSFFDTFAGLKDSGSLLTPDLTIVVNLKDCPLGFNLSHATGKCECDPRLDGDSIECFINDQSFLCRANSWIGFINESSSTPGVMFHPNCPIGYCLPRDVNVTSNTSDRQCEPHRTGLLCGKCKAGYSLTLGNDKCAECSNTHLLLLLPLAVAGLLLVAVLFALNLTVTEGSINGLIFYANVIDMNHAVLFSEEISYLYTFLAWLNLDLGISTCLFNGMDGFAETWLQFVYPAYLWIIILIVIQLYRKYPTLANKLGGENAVKVLATLFLLSYTKLQRTVVTIMSFTRLEYPDGVVHYVWLYDANVEFFKGKHLYLGLAGILVLVFLIVPYTLCLAFFQQLQACSGHRLFQWVNKLKPVFDSYAGPYKDKYRFWTGMLLVVRTLLIILFTNNIAGSVDVNLLIILVVSFALCMANSNGTYKKWPYNYLESFFYLQLGVFAGGVLYARHNHGSITAVADTSIGLTLIVFLAVVGYHALRQVSFIRKCYYRFIMGYRSVDDEDLMLTHERFTS